MLTVLAASIIAIVILSGCGGGGGSSTTTTGVEAVGTLLASRTATRIPIQPGYEQMNPHYKDEFQVPSSYSVAISKMELLRSADDTDPYVIFDTESLENPKVIQLTGDGASQSFGENSAYPSAGTYTHMRVTMVYHEPTILADVNDGNGYVAHKFRIYCSTVGAVQDGDVLNIRFNV